MNRMKSIYYSQDSGADGKRTLDELIQDAKDSLGTEYSPENSFQDDECPPEVSVSKKKLEIKRFRIPGPVIAVLVALAALLFASLLARFIWKCADDVLALTRPSEDVEIEVEKGDGLNEITQKLYEANAIEYPWLFRLYCNVTDAADSFGEGRFILNKTYDYHAIVNNLMPGSSDRQTVRITVVEGMNCYSVFELLSEKGVCSRLELEDAVEHCDFDYDFLGDAPFEGSNRFEGYLFPDTYEFYYRDDPERVLNKFLKNFERHVDDDVLDIIDSTGYSLHDILKIASIIEKESTGIKTAAGDDVDRKNVSSVIHNRLSSGYEPYLKMDSTVNYASMLANSGFDINIDSPFNTYLHQGLPSGPICNPGLDAILAAAQPASTDYLYFATDKDGNNRFFFDSSAFNAFVASDEYLYN